MLRRIIFSIFLRMQEYQICRDFRGKQDFHQPFTEKGGKNAATEGKSVYKGRMPRLTFQFFKHIYSQSTQPMNSINFSGATRAITSLIRLLPVPAPKPVAFPYRAFHISQRIERRRNGASNDIEQGTAGEQLDATATPKKRRRRLDEVCLEQYPEYSRNVIQSWIAQGK